MNMCKLNNNKNNNLFSLFLLIGINAILVSIVIPVYMIGLSPEDFAYIDFYGFFGVSMVFFLALLIIQLLLFVPLVAFGCQIMCRSILLGISCWLILAGFIFPLAKSKTMTDAIDIPINTTSLIFVLLLTLLCVFFVSRNKGKFVFIFLSIVVVVAILPQIPLLVETFYGSNKEGFDVLSRKRNVIVISLDGIPGNVALDLVMDDQLLEKKFKDFSIYQNAVSTSPGTVGSIMGELYGNYDFLSVANTEKGLLQALDKDHLLVNQDEYDVYTYGAYNYFNTDPTTRIPFGGLEKMNTKSSNISNVVDLYDYVSVRIGTRFLASLFNQMDGKINDGLLALMGLDELENNAGKLSEQLKNHQGPDYEKVNILTINDYNAFKENMSVGTDQLCIRYMHFAFTHYPVDFNANGEYHSNDKAWFSEHQNEIAVRAESEWCMYKINEMIDSLKRIGAYDNSLIVFKSDHGKYIRYSNSPPNCLSINGHSAIGVNRYMPMLMIKDWNQENQAPLYIDDFVLLDDLAKTLWLKVNGENGSEQFSGINLMEGEGRGNGPFSIYVPSDNRSNHRIDTHSRVYLRRNINIYNALKESDELNLNSVIK